MDDHHSFPLEMKEGAQHTDATTSAGVQYPDRERHFPAPQNLSEMEMAQQTDGLSRIFRQVTG